MRRNLSVIALIVGILPGVAQVSSTAQPAPEMKQLGAFTGSWTGTTSRTGTTPERASATFRILHGGHWFRGDLSLGRDLDATIMIGWNEAEKAFRVHLFESNRPAPTLAKGTMNRESFVLESQGGESRTVRWTLQIPSGKTSEFTLTREFRSSAGWVQDSVTTLRRPERGEGGGMTLPRD